MLPPIVLFFYDVAAVPDEEPETEVVVVVRNRTVTGECTAANVVAVTVDQAVASARRRAGVHGVPDRHDAFNQAVRHPVRQGPAEAIVMRRDRAHCHPGRNAARPYNEDAVAPESLDQTGQGDIRPKCAMPGAGTCESGTRSY